MHFHLFIPIYLA